MSLEKKSESKFSEKNEIITRFIKKNDTNFNEYDHFLDGITCSPESSSINEAGEMILDEMSCSPESSSINEVDEVVMASCLL
jgi:hypothetical protein